MGPQELRILTLDTMTIKEIRAAVAKVLDEKSLSKVKLVRRYGDQSFIGLNDDEYLGKRRELLMMGRDLPPPSKGPPVSALPSSSEAVAVPPTPEAAAVPE